VARQQTAAGTAFRYEARDAHAALSGGGPRPIPFRVTVDGEPSGRSHGVDTDADGRGVLGAGRMYQLVRAHAGNRVRRARHRGVQLQLRLARSVSAMRSTFAAAAALLLLIMPASARASLRDCHIQATSTATISSARDMSCERAAREMRDYKGQISRRFTTPARFMCTRVSGGQFGGQWRCVHRNKAFRFEFRD
jgi:thioredoxin family protein